jgi:hypothetical protein
VPEPEVPEPEVDEPDVDEPDDDEEDEEADDEEVSLLGVFVVLESPEDDPSPEDFSVELGASVELAPARESVR